ncbi:MAG: transglutaminase family protein [Desulfatirhabdiaceae bacterium]
MYFKNNLSIILTALFSGLMFLTLMGVQDNWFSSSTPSGPGVTGLAFERETWMAIYQNDHPIGYTYRKTTPDETGYQTTETTRMKINSMGIVQDVVLNLKARLNPDFSLLTMSVDLGSGLFRFKASGQVDGKFLILRTSDRQTSLPLEDPVYLPTAVLDGYRLRIPKGTEGIQVPVFDPFTFSREMFRLEKLGQESLEIMGQRMQTQKIQAEFRGIRQIAWLDENGDVVQEQGGMGFLLKKVSAEEALSIAQKPAGEDITLQASIPSNKLIRFPDILKRLSIRFSGNLENLMLHGGRQKWDGDILTIDRETLSARTEEPVQASPEFLRPSLFVQSDHPEIVTQVSDITSLSDNPQKRIRKILSWMNQNIQKRPVISMSNALETLKNRAGDCNEFAMLFCAMARAAGVPTRIEAGLVYMNGRFYYHAWNAVLIGDWITVDSLMNQFPADVTHIRLVIGEFSEQTGLIAGMGTLRPEILEMER